MGLIAIDSKLANTPLCQQNMKQCTPIFSPLIVAAIFCVFGIVFTVLGPVLIKQSQDLLYEKFTHANGQEDVFEFPAAHVNRMKDLRVYYQTNISQNIRSYVSSVDYKQLKAKNFQDVAVNDKCKSVPKEQAIDYPCGLIYHTFPANESYHVFLGDQPLEYDKDILRTADIKRQTIFGPAFRNLQDWQRVADWMRPAAFTPAQKIYGIIGHEQFTSLANAGAKVRVTASGDYEYAPSRTLIIAQAGVFGLRSETKQFGELSLTFGVICLAGAILFTAGYFYIRTHSSKNQRTIKQLQRLSQSESSGIAIAVETPAPLASVQTQQTQPDNDKVLDAVQK